ATSMLAASPTPDLAVTNARLVDGSLQVTVANLGSAPATFKVSDIDAPVPWLCTMTKSCKNTGCPTRCVIGIRKKHCACASTYGLEKTHTVTAGGSVVVSIPNIAAPSKPQQLEVSLELPAIAEARKDNNRLTVTIQPSAASKKTQPLSALRCTRA
ncbi:hypothetical protein HYS54_03160, partial [Candidatus Micrarchaeota archaeon]|nr:hypothetical protein [Candidatus Micrarchaeota archaeon]